MSGRWARTLSLLMALLLPVLLLGCPKEEEVIVETAAGVHLTPDQIDQDPIALLPGGAVGLVRLDARQLFSSQFGQQLLHVARSRMPLPPAAGFDPQRDLATMHIGFYSMQGVDFVAVATGTFNPQAIEQAADGTTNTPLGAPLVKQPYADRTLYLSRNVGFAVVTARTVLLGNETAIRRALDRIREGRVQRAVPSWYDELIQGQTAPVVGGMDLRTNPIAGPAAANLPFMQGVETARMVGNFQPPGMNIAGTFTYKNEETAQTGATTLMQFRDWMKSMSFFTALLGFGQPIHKLEARAEGKSTQFVASVEGAGISKMLDQLATTMGAPAAPGRPQ